MPLVVKMEMELIQIYSFLHSQILTEEAVVEGVINMCHKSLLIILLISQIIQWVWH